MGERQWERLEAVAEAAHVAGLPPDQATYNTLIAAYSRRKQWDRVDAASQSLLAATGGAPRSAQTYAALVKAYGRGRMFSRIDSALAEMQSTGVQPTLAVYNALIYAYGRGHKAELAVRKPSPYPLRPLLPPPISELGGKSTPRSLPRTCCPHVFVSGCFAVRGEWLALSCLQ